MKTYNASKVVRFSTGSTVAVLAGLLWLVAADVRGDSFFRTNTLPPGGQYRTSPGSATTYPNGVIIVNLVESQFTSTYVPPALGSNQFQSFSAALNFMVSLNGGSTYACVSATASVVVRVTHSSDAGGTQFFDTEMLSLNISGGGLPPGVMLRESPTLVSPGQTTIRSVPDGYMISSFFDVFTELSLDGGATWTPAGSAMALDLAGNVVNSVPSANMPSAGGQYRNNQNAPCSPLTFGGGRQIRNIREYNFSTSYAPPALGATEFQNHSATVAFEFSADGGNTYSPVTAPANVAVNVNHITNSGTTQIFQTEMLQLDISGGTLPQGVMLRESPTLLSRGRTTLQPGGDGYQVSSFFDVFTELSPDGGQTWIPATRSERLDLTAPCLRIVCPSNITVTASNQVGATVYFSVTATELCDNSFVTTATPPSGSTFPIGSTLVSCTASNALGQIATCSFVVTVQPPLEVDYFPWSLARVTLKYPNGATEVVALAGPTTVHVTIPPNGAALDTDADGRDQVGTKMVQLDLHGSSSLGPVTVRLNPA
ncbi:MAG: HYR domain-containing protein, partial [Verrucomicrobia bacterium]|nr:HYR domain-containing protein [Verrucomicrobiota bacterium]